MDRSISGLEGNPLMPRWKTAFVRLMYDQMKVYHLSETQPYLDRRQRRYKLLHHALNPTCKHARDGTSSAATVVTVTLSPPEQLEGDEQRVTVALPNLHFQGFNA